MHGFLISFPFVKNNLYDRLFITVPLTVGKVPGFNSLLV
jgi:hypothetical protein